MEPVMEPDPLEDLPYGSCCDCCCCSGLCDSMADWDMEDEDDDT